MVQTDFFSQSDSTGGGAVAPTVQPAQGGLFDRAVLLSLSISCLGIKRRVQSSVVECDADKSMISVSKSIIDSPILADIKKFDGQTRAWIAERSLPSMFRSGVYLWPIALLVDADDYLQTRIEQRRGMVNRFLDMYQSVKLDAEARLGSLYNPADYPDAEKVQAAFGMSYQYIECGVPGRLRDIAPEMWRREQEKAERVWHEALGEAKDMLRGELVELVEHMRERLEPGEDGKPKKFKNTLVSNLSSFLSLFEARNLADDRELQAVVSQCREILSGVSSEAIRDDATMRARVAAGMETIKGQLDNLVIAGGRSINLDTDEQADNWGDI